jgi:hypothetical protein
VRVPPEARGEEFKGTHATRTLGSRDKAEALRNLPKVYDDLQAEFDKAAAKQSTSSKIPLLSLEELCRLQRERLLDSERQFRKEHIGGFIGDPVQLAQQYRKRLLDWLQQARARAIVHDYQYDEWFLTFLEKSGRGEVADRSRALPALARTTVKVVEEIIADDDALALEAAVQQQPGVPTLKEHSDAYLARRGSELTGERRAMIEAVVRDFVALTGGDRAISAYTKADAARFIDALLCLPANWVKDRKLRELDIATAAATAKSLGMPRQSAESIRKKVALIASVFADGKERFDGVAITFSMRLPKRPTANAAGDPYGPRELAKVLSSDLPGHLYWLTWLALCTGGAPQ